MLAGKQIRPSDSEKKKSVEVRRPWRGVTVAGIPTARKFCTDEKHIWESSGAGTRDLTEKVVIDYEAITPLQLSMTHSPQQHSN